VSSLTALTAVCAACAACSACAASPSATDFCARLVPRRESSAVVAVAVSIDCAPKSGDLSARESRSL
jgi:hypothetical protein